MEPTALDFNDLPQLATALANAVAHREYQGAAALLLILGVWLVRYIGPKLKGPFFGKLGALICSARGGAVISLVIGQIGAVATSLIAGKPLAMDLILSGLVTAATGSGLHAITKSVKAPIKRVKRTRASDPPAQAGEIVAAPEPPPPGASGVLPEGVPVPTPDLPEVKP